MDRKRLSFFDHILATFFGATIVVVTAQVLFRYVLNRSLAWTEELSRYLFVWIIFLGAALAIRDATHIRIDMLVTRLPKAAARAIGALTHWLILAFLVLLVVLGFRLVHHTAGTPTPTLRLPENLVYYAALPVSFLLAVYYVAKQILAAIRSDRSTEPPDGEAS